MKALTPGLFFALSLCAHQGMAQSPISDDFLRLQTVLQQAKMKLAPSTVTVQTFGGTRKVEERPKGPTPEPDKPAPMPPENPKNPKKKKKRPPPLGMQGFLQAQGATTGIVLSADGWILVSRFALNYDPTTILVTLQDGRSFHAVRKGEDTSREIALVKIEAEDLPVPEFLAPDDIAVGSWAFVLGRTFGATDPSVHMGVVSAKGRIFGRAVQIDAYTSPANYGGPVIDVQGRVMGIAVPLDASGRKANVNLYDSGIGFASTIADISPLLERMKEGEVLHRGYLGISSDPKFLGPGAELANVMKKSAAHNAGLRKGHLILEVDGVKLKNSFHLQNLVGSKMAGDPVSLKVKKKDGEEFGVTVFLTEVPESEREAKKPEEDAEDLPWEDRDKKK